jgi:hypothetical protein
MFDEKLTTEERLTRIQDSIKVFQEEERKLLGQKKDTAAQSVTARVEQEEREAAAFDKMTPSELLQLYQTDKEQWQRLLDAKERQGLRKLMGR